MENKDIVQSYILTAARYNFSVYEKRILYRIIEGLQQYREGKKLNEKFSVTKDLFGDRWITIDLNSLLKTPGEDKNHYNVKKALRRLREKTIEYQDDKVWTAFGFIESPEIESYKSLIKFRLHWRMYDAFLDFSDGYREYELKTAMMFKSEFSMRFYELFSGKKTPLVFSIDKLKNMFGMEDKYKGRPSDFIRFVIETAQKELTEKAPYSFTFEKLKTGRKITHIKFNPYYIEENRDPELERKKLQKKTSVRFDLSKDVIFMLKEKFNFTQKGLENNRDLLIEAVKHPEFRDICNRINGDIRAKSSKVKNPTGLLISELKKLI